MTSFRLGWRERAKPFALLLRRLQIGYSRAICAMTLAMLYDALYRHTVVDRFPASPLGSSLSYPPTR